MSRILATPLQFETCVFRAISSCFPYQIGGYLQAKVTKMAQGDKRNTIQFGFLWFLRSYVIFKVYIWKKESSIIFEENIRNDFSSLSIKVGEVKC